MDNQNDFYPENDIENQIEETSAENSADEPVIEGEEIEEEYKFAPIIFPNSTKPLFVYTEDVPKGHTLETFNEKRRLKRSGNTIGVSFLAMLGAVTAVNLLLTVVVLIITFVSGNQDAANFLSDAFFVHILQIFLSSLMFTVPFIFVFRKFKEKIGDLVSFSKPKPKRSLPLFLFGIGFCAFANIASSVIATIFEKIGFEQSPVGLEDPEGIYGFLIVFISTAVVPALVEEFACRGLVMGLLCKYGDRFAIIASAILFGLMHGNFAQIPFAFLVGLALGFISIKAESLWPAVAVHFFNNLSAVVFSYLPVSVNLSNIFYTIFLCVCMLLGLLGILLLRNDKEIFTLQRDGQVVSEKKKYLYFFTSVPIIITVAYCLLEAVLVYVM